MNIIFPYLIFLSQLTANNNDTFGLSILFILFLLLIGGGYKLIRLRTGNYDVDYFTKLLGWGMAVIGAIGIFQCFQYIK